MINTRNGIDRDTFVVARHDYICFAKGTMIATINGERAIEDLQAGDKVITRDNGLQAIAWIGHKALDSDDLRHTPKLRPILIKAGALGNDMPERDLMVSPNHRMLIANDVTSVLFDERETLVAAKHLVGKPGIEVADVVETTYYHMLFAHHEVVLSNGAWSESFQPGDYSMGTLDDAQRDEIFALFPELKEHEGLGDYVSARRSLNKKEAALLRAS